MIRRRKAKDRLLVLRDEDVERAEGRYLEHEPSRRERRQQDPRILSAAVLGRGLQERTKNPGGHVDPVFQQPERAHGHGERRGRDDREPSAAPNGERLASTLARVDIDGVGQSRRGASGTAAPRRVAAASNRVEPCRATRVGATREHVTRNLAVREPDVPRAGRSVDRARERDVDGSASPQGDRHDSPRAEAVAGHSLGKEGGVRDHDGPVVRVDREPESSVRARHRPRRIRGQQAKLGEPSSHGVEHRRGGHGLAGRRADHAGFRPLDGAPLVAIQSDPLGIVASQTDLDLFPFGAGRHPPVRHPALGLDLHREPTGGDPRDGESTVLIRRRGSNREARGGSAGIFDPKDPDLRPLDRHSGAGDASAEGTAEIDLEIRGPARLQRDVALFALVVLLTEVVEQDDPRASGGKPVEDEAAPRVRVGRPPPARPEDAYRPAAGRQAPSSDEPALQSRAGVDADRDISPGHGLKRARSERGMLRHRRHGLALAERAGSEAPLPVGRRERIPDLVR